VSRDLKRQRFKKGNLPSKICAACQRPFDWRKKWEHVWDEVRYCSDRCRSAGKGGGGQSGRQTD
jgi:hypothetical protein